jgi:Neocarzinostatin family./Calx-beta domain.
MRARYGAGVIGLVATVALAFPVGAASGSGLGSAALSGDGAPSALPATPAPTAPVAPMPRAPISPIPGVPADGVLHAMPVGPSAAAPTISATPSTNLKPGQTVTVTGSGFAPGDPNSPGIPLLECVAGATTLFDCGAGNGGFASPDATGAFSTPFVVARTLATQSGSVRCDTSVGACVLAALIFPSLDIAASVNLGFDPTVPVPHPQLAVNPATGILDGQTVTVSGSGFAPGHTVSVSQCATGPSCFTGVIGPGVTVAADGTFSSQVTMSLRVFLEDGTVTHCLAVGCQIQANDDVDPEYSVTKAVAFDPNQPLPPTPTISVTPATGLHHGQSVTVSGVGFDPQAGVEISQCGPNNSGFCADFLTDLVAGADGTFTTSVQVSRLITGFDLLGGGPTTTTLDCATIACAINADESTASEFSLSARASISFDGSVPPPALPVVTAAPLTNLPYRATVTVHGTGFSPGEAVSSESCLSGPSFGTCGGFGFGTADGNGAVTLSVPVRRTARGFDGGTVDCVDPAVSCQVSVFGQHGYEQFEFPLTFDPNAPIPPPPTVSATPTSGLGYRQPVTVRGAGFAPDAEIGITECSGNPSSDLGEVCSAFASVIADQNGGFETTFPARRFLGGPFNPAVDCASAATPCALSVFDSFDGFGGDGQSIPLSFDPNSVAPPPPHLEVSPDDHLHDGDAVDVRGSKFSPNAQIAVLECAGTATSIGDCDFSQPLFVTTDGRGRFMSSATVKTAVQTFSSPVDCGSGGCEILAFNLADDLEAAVAPLSFDIPEIDLHGVSVREGTGGVTPAPVGIELSDPAAGPVTVHWKAVVGTATTADYTATAGTVTIPAGATSATIPAEVVADALDEPTERFTVVIDSATGATVEDGSATVKIKDDDHEPDISIGDKRVREDAGVVDVPVILSAPSGRTVTVEFRTHHRSARSGHDFTRTRGVATFAPGQTLALVSVPIVDDTRGEKVESFRVELDDAEHADITDDSATVTIIDND